MLPIQIKYVDEQNKEDRGGESETERMRVGQRGEKKQDKKEKKTEWRKRDKQDKK
jgi:hypothetical protein